MKSKASACEPNLLVKASDVRVMHRIDKLDSIRFIAAFWVVMSHGAIPFKELFSNAPLQRLAEAFGASFDGVSAVIVFFIVSGFCIHLPYLDAPQLPLAKFFIRRYIRIGIPLTAIVLIMQLVGGSASERGFAVLWSIYSELAYYTMYPLLFALAKRCGWVTLIAISSLVSATLIIVHSDSLWVWQFGWLTWLWGLPVWLSGCQLAEQFRTRRLINVHGN
jgi:peptidoglycan/LPS O-acetylase OafA/YrhL